MGYLRTDETDEIEITKRRERVLKRSPYKSILYIVMYLYCIVFYCIVFYCIDIVDIKQTQ
jgi:hypothetical protein